MARIDDMIEEPEHSYLGAEFGRRYVDPSTATNARQAGEYLASNEALQAAAREEAELKRKADEATIELSGVMKKQNELLLVQLKKSEEARTAAEKQAREERVWKWVMFVVALLSIVVAVVF